MREKPFILIIDDDENDAFILKRILDRHNWDSHFIFRGSQAYEQAVDLFPDLILLDIRLPDVDGFQICHLLKSNEFTREIPVIFLTAFSDDEAIQKSFKLGAVDYIKKPFNICELENRINTQIELKRAKENLIKVNNELLKINQELKEQSINKDKLFSILSHDIKSAMSGIKGLMQYIITDFEDISKNDVYNILQNIYNTTSKTCSFINDFLEWTKVQMKGFKVIKKDILLYDLILELYEYFNSEIISKNLKFNLNIDKNFVIYSDENIVRIIIRNILSNSIKFSYPNGEILINLNKRNNKPQLYIKDYGIGMDNKTLASLFDIEQIHSVPGTRNEQGSGLGLLLLKELADKANIKIFIESFPEYGTEIYLEFPEVN